MASLGLFQAAARTLPEPVRRLRQLDSSKEENIRRSSWPAFVAVMKGAPQTLHLAPDPARRPRTGHAGSRCRFRSPLCRSCCLPGRSPGSGRSRCSANNSERPGGFRLRSLTVISLGGQTSAQAPQPRHFAPSMAGRPRNRGGAFERHKRVRQGSPGRPEADQNLFDCGDHDFILLYRFPLAHLPAACYRGDLASPPGGVQRPVQKRQQAAALQTLQAHRGQHQSRQSKRDHRCEIAHGLFDLQPRKHLGHDFHQHGGHKNLGQGKENIQGQNADFRPGNEHFHEQRKQARSASSTSTT